MTFPDSFETARLRAERLRPDHFEAIHRMHQDPVHMATLGGIRDLAQTTAYMTHNLQHWADHGFGVWLLREPTTNVVAGRALLRRLIIDGMDEVEVGYGILPAYWGRGLAPEIAAECLRLGRDVLGMVAIIGLTLPDNTRSRRVLDRIGMRYERDVSHGNLRHVMYRTQPMASRGVA